MKKIFLLLIVFLAGITQLLAKNVFAESERLLNEGRTLFRLEKASWYATDIFQSDFPGDTIVGGYVSYITDDNFVKTVFFSRNDPNKIVVQYVFDTIPTLEPLSVKTSPSQATPLEKELITMRLDAIQRVEQNNDNFFTLYQNTSFNFIPVITKKTQKVYILTGPLVSGVVLIGNDYLLTYKKGEFKKKEKIHNSLIELPTKSKEEGEGAITSTIHSHVLSDFINVTDICTLLLYKDFIEWKQHYVISKKYINIFDLESENLLIITRKSWEKIYGSPEEK